MAAFHIEDIPAIDESLSERRFLGTLYFLELSGDSSATCDLEFVRYGPRIVARVTLSGKGYEVTKELLLCPDGEQRFWSRKDIAPYGQGPSVQLSLMRNRLTSVTAHCMPHLRVVGMWVERKEDKNGKVRAASWGIEGLLKESRHSPSPLSKPEKQNISELERKWSQLEE